MLVLQSPDLNCQICNGAMQPLFLKHGYWICVCTNCGHQSAGVGNRPEHVALVYGDEYFQGGGAGYSDYLAEQDILRHHGRRYGRLLRNHMQPGTMLDVGAAAGFILQGMIDEGWSGRGVEPNRQMSDHARARLGLDVETGSFESFPTGEQFDLVTMIQVVAHFPDVREAFQKAAEIIRPGGFCLIETWNRDSWTARIFGRHWHEYSPPSVLHWFTPATLRTLAEQFGFREVAQGRPAKWLNGAHALSLLTYKLGGSFPRRLLAGAGKLFPRNIPLPYLADDLFWMLFIQNPPLCRSEIRSDRKTRTRSDTSRWVRLQALRSLAARAANSTGSRSRLPCKGRKTPMCSPCAPRS